MPNFRSIRKATDAEKAEYEKHDPVYGLFGFIYMTAEGGEPIECFVEDLRMWPKGDPQWEIVFPEGWNAGHCHSLCCFDQKDVIERAGEWLTPCTKGGGCGCRIDEGEDHG